jgi:hypothetical protein
MGVKIYKCFVASPSDTVGERSACDEVFFEINQTLGRKFDFRIESVKWEKDACPGFGEDGQDVINKQLTPGDHDFFVGIMWKQFGTPTSRAGSGTEEEFNQAYKSLSERTTHSIQMYFNDASPSSLNEIDAGQLEKVKTFKKKVMDLGGLYCSYRSVDDFKSRLRTNITNELLRIFDAPSETNRIKDVLEDRLQKSLSLFSSQPVKWIDRILCENDSIVGSFDQYHEKTITVDGLLKIEDFCIIKAPPQFGQTCLSHYMVKQAWENGLAWAYLDFDRLKMRKLEEDLNAEKTFFGRDSIDCIILDSWEQGKTGSQKVIELINSICPDVRLLIMETVTDSLDAFKSTQVRMDRNFRVLNLLALPRTEVRKAVCAYTPKILNDENTVLNKLLLDLDTLNIHRTPMNCWTLLMVAERNSDTSPVNRTQMLEMVLFILFNLNDIPGYQTVPDAKDCEHVLGHFCEQLIRKSQLVFAQEEFTTVIRQYCDQKLVDVDVSTLFGILHENHIIIETFSGYRFKATFWVYYFAAKQMTNNPAFKDYILSDRRYACYPEIIEFYTGIDRNKSEIVEILCEDLSSTRKVLDEKLGFSGVLNPLSALSWTPKDEAVEKMKKQLSDDVINSNVPDAIKDMHADQSYNHLKPYDQDIRQFLNESSFALFIHQLQAASTALRNSDYADVSLRKKALREIVHGWVEVSKVIFVLTPILAQRGYASFEGFGFNLSKDFKRGEVSEEKLLVQILKNNPHNVVSYVKDDLSSERIGPLLYDLLRSDLNVFAEHLLMLYLISERPRNWEKYIDSYIAGQDKNSLYLLNVYDQLVGVYRYVNIVPQDDAVMCRLMKKCLAKHHLAIKNPVGKNLDRIKDSALPKKINTDEASKVLPSEGEKKADQL